MGREDVSCERLAQSPRGNQLKMSALKLKTTLSHLLSTVLYETNCSQLFTYIFSSSVKQTVIYGVVFKQPASNYRNYLYSRV